ncbi:amidohydrolase family protein [Candidatus Latescibacterota bacterium]
MAKLTYFDCNCSIGRVPYPHIYDIADVAGLRKEMDIAGIEEALVFHAVARDADPPLGNQILMEALKDAQWLHPCWVVLPHYTGEMPPPAKLLDTMLANDVRAVRMYPTRAWHSFSMADWNIGELLSALAEAHVPLLLDVEIVTWDTVQRLLEAYPGLPVVATNVSYRHNRFTYPLFERYENLYVELSRYFGFRVIEEVVERFGSRHLLFGSNLPQYTGTAPVSHLTYAEISREDKESIAGSNLRLLLKEALS